MSDIAKWALLVAGAIILIGMILSLPIVNVIDMEQLSAQLASFATVLNPYLQFGRGIINCFLYTWCRPVLTGVLLYVIGKYFYTMGIKILTWIYHFIFK